MCHHPGCPEGVCFIIPPHLLEHVAIHAEEHELRQRALENLHLQGHIRGMREGIAQFGFAGLSPGVKHRTIYDAKHSQQLPGSLVRDEGQPKSTDPCVNEAYDYAGDTYDFYLQVLKRNSIDGNGMRLNSTVHFGTKYDNAFWNGQQMVYGDGDGTLFNCFTKCIDVIGHELTHGVTQFTAKLAYHDQPGALNESMSDVFGALVKQYHAGQTVTQADWLIGQGLFVPKPGVDRTALRSMKAPGTAYNDPTTIGKDPQPADMAHYVQTSSDSGGVHINSGIPNHAFYLAAMAIGGKAWDVTGRIWYEALTGGKLSPQAQFADAAHVIRDAAKAHGPAAAKAVDDAWKKVGL